MYKTKIGIKNTQKAIQEIKYEFPKLLSKELKLTRVSAPLFLEPGTG